MKVSANAAMARAYPIAGLRFQISGDAMAFELILETALQLRRPARSRGSASILSLSLKLVYRTKQGFFGNKDVRFVPLLQILEWAKANLLGLWMLHRTRNVEGSCLERIVAQSRLRMSDGGALRDISLRSSNSVAFGAKRTFNKPPYRTGLMNTRPRSSEGSMRGNVARYSSTSSAHPNAYCKYAST
jgi:hypothetical protein